MFLVENIQKDNYTELLVYSRDKNDVKHVEKIRDFKPYFYVNSDEIIPDDYRITKRETGHKSLTGQDVTKIYVKRSKDIIGVKDLFQTHHEADVPFTQRYIIDRIGEAEITNFILCP